MKAEQARKIADEVNGGDFENILKNIEAEAKAGGYHLKYENTNKGTSRKLKELGYEFDSNPMTGTVFITW